MPALPLDPVSAGDVGVVERRHQTRLALEAGEPLRIEGERFGEHLDGDPVVKPRVAPQIDHAHAAAAEFALDRVGADPFGCHASGSRDFIVGRDT